MNPDPLLDAVFSPPDALPAALRAARRRRTLRRARQAAPVLVAAIGSLFFFARRPATAPAPALDPGVASVGQAPTIDDTSPFVVNTSAAGQISTVRTVALTILTVSDEDFLALASSPGRPAALVHREGDRAHLLVTRDAVP